MGEPTPALVADVRWAAAAVRHAVDAAMDGQAPLATCRECGAAFYFFTPGGLVATAVELCPRCEPAEHRPVDGVALELHAVTRAAADRRGLLSVARLVATDRACSFEDAVFFLERVESGDDPFRRMLALARQVVVDPVAAWRAAYITWTTGLAVAAAAHPVAAAMARLAATARPDAVTRCVVKAKRTTLYDGPVDAGGVCGRTIREGEAKHGRKLRVTLHHADGTKTHRRGERGEAPEHRFDDAALGGVRAMMAKSAAPVTLADVKAAVAVLEANSRPLDSLTHDEVDMLLRGAAEIEAALGPVPRLRADCAIQGHDEPVLLNDVYVCRRCGEMGVPIHPAPAERMR